MKTKITLKPIIMIVAFCLIESANAQIGEIDPSFSSDGIVNIDIASGWQQGYGIAIQPDGKIVLAGNHDNGTDSDGLVCRLNADGSLDNSFSGDGTALIDLSGESIEIRDVVIQADNKIVFCGSGYLGPDSEFIIGRLNADGTMDNTFDADGVAAIDITGFGSLDMAFSLAHQSDGKIVATGAYDYGAGIDMCVVRLNTNGSLDNSFATNGILPVDAGSDAVGWGIGIQPDGKIVISGTIYLADDDFVVARINTDGTLDASFDSDGLAFTDISGSDDEGWYMTLQTDGKIVVAGNSNNGPDIDFSIVRYNTDGSLDNTFDFDGRLSHDLGASDDFAYRIIQEPDGKLIAVGVRYTFTGWSIALTRYNTDGSIDITWGASGEVITFIADGCDAHSLAFQPDGKVVAVGTVYNAGIGDYDLVAVRYLAQLDAGILIPEPASGLSAQPNPFTDVTKIRFDKALINGSIVVTDISGRVVKTIHGVSGNFYPFFSDDLGDGVYFATVSDEGCEEGTLKLVVGE